MTLLSVQAAAKTLGVSERTAYRVIRQECRHVYVRGCLRVPDSELTAWLKRNIQAPEEACLHSSGAVGPGTGTGATPRAGSTAKASARRTRRSPATGSASARLRDLARKLKDGA